MDLDISCRRPLQPLLEFAAWFPRAQPLGVGNDLMAARRHHPVMGELVQQLIPYNLNLLFPYLTIFYSTGPQFTSSVLQSWFSNKGVKSQNITEMRSGRSEANTLSRLVYRLMTNSPPDPNSVYVLPEIFYSGKHTFFGHRPGGTWYGKDVAVVLWFVNRPWAILLLVVIVICPFFIFVKRAKLRDTLIEKWKSI
ncbi:hypothetical protein V8C35DRAFT_285916 [Trichoderma chlorosporum]